MAELKTSKVVVVGAGIAGISAAARLFEYGYRNVVVLEATDRVGGRICTKEFGDGWVELGAQWIHGEEDNAAFEFAAKHDLVKPSCETEFQEQNHVSEDGLVLDRTLVERVVEGIQEELDAFHEQCPEGIQQATVEACVDQIFMKNFGQSRHPEEEAQKKALLNWCKSFQCSIEGCDSLAAMKMASFLKYRECNGNILTNFKNGYHSLVHAVANSLPPKSILLSKPVTQVQLVSDTGASRRLVRVVCRDGSVLEADHVVVTASLGFLKSNAATLFQPPLPAAKLDVIQKLGFGTVDKIFLEFERPFWGPNSSGYSLVWRNKNTSPTKLWFQAIFGFYTVPFATNVLCGWIVGAEARHMETLSNEEVKDQCVKLLQRFTGKADLPPVKSIIRSSWQSNEYTRGSYSFYAKEECSNSVLAEPVYLPFKTFQHPAVLFAGEHTHPHYFSTVHGAMETGWREADRIMAYQAALCAVHPKL